MVATGLVDQPVEVAAPLCSTSARPKRHVVTPSQESSGTSRTIELLGVSRVHGAGRAEVLALSDVTLHVDAGEHVSLIGPSGSGKSTLLNLIAGLDVPTSGSVRVCGHDLAGLDDAQVSRMRLKTIGFDFQAFNLFPSFTAWENVAWPLELRGATRAEVAAHVGPLLERLGVADRRDHRPGEMSGGEQQRVAIARALVNDPTILLADEPTGNLDSATAAVVLELLADVRRERGATLVVATHDGQVAAAGDRVVALSDGRVVPQVV
jgi:putative ABC transport system ATP-binding protein